MFIALLEFQILFFKENLLFSFPWQHTKFLGDFFFFILTFLESQCTKLSGKLNMIGQLYFNQTH